MPAPTITARARTERLRVGRGGCSRSWPTDISTALVGRQPSQRGGRQRRPDRRSGLRRPCATSSSRCASRPGPRCARTSSCATSASAARRCARRSSASRSRASSRSARARARTSPTSRRPTSSTSPRCAPSSSRRPRAWPPSAWTTRLRAAAARLDAELVAIEGTHRDRRLHAPRRARAPLRLGGGGEPVPRSTRSSACGRCRCASGTSCSSGSRRSRPRSTSSARCSHALVAGDARRAGARMREHVQAFETEILDAFSR